MQFSRGRMFRFWSKRNMRQSCFTHTHTRNMRPLENCMADFCAMADLSTLLGMIYCRNLSFILFVTFYENHASNLVARSTSIHFMVVYDFAVSIKYVVGYWCVLAGEILDWCCQITVGLADCLNQVVVIGRFLADILLERRLVDRAFLRRQSLVDSGGRLRAWPPGHYSHLHGPTNHRRHRQPQGEPFPQRRRLPPGLAHCRFADRCVVRSGYALDGGGHCSIPDPRRQPENGVRRGRARGTSDVPGCTGTACDQHDDFRGDWCQYFHDRRPQTHSDAGAVWCVSLYGPQCS